MPEIKDSGNRRAFATGAFRDIQEGKGRNDLLHPDVMLRVLRASVCEQSYDPFHYKCFAKEALFIWYAGRTVPNDVLAWAFIYGCRMLVEEELGKEAGEYTHHYMCVIHAISRLSKHYEKGTKKYGEHNWLKGIPSVSFYDSAHRHIDKHLLGQRDEDHLAAFLFNVTGIMYNEMFRKELENKFYEGSPWNTKKDKREDPFPSETKTTDPVSQADSDIKEKLSAFIKKHPPRASGGCFLNRLPGFLQAMRERKVFIGRSKREYLRVPNEGIIPTVRKVQDTPHSPSVGLEEESPTGGIPPIQRPPKRVFVQRRDGQNYCYEGGVSLLSEEDSKETRLE